MGLARVRVLCAGSSRRAAARAIAWVCTEQGERRPTPHLGTARPERAQLAAGSEALPPNLSAHGLCARLTLCFFLPGVQLCHGELAKERALRHEQRTEPTAHREASQRDR